MTNAEWDITVEQLVNGMTGVERFTLHDTAFAEIKDGEILSWRSELKPSAILHPKYAFAKVDYCEPIGSDGMRVFIIVEQRRNGDE